VPTEARRQLGRVFSNYARLGATFLVGIVMTRLQIRWLGIEGFGLIALLMATMGLGTLFNDLSRQSLVRELGQWRRSDEARFLRAYNSSFVLSTAMGGLTFAALLVVFLILPLLKIDADLLNAARIFVIARAVRQTAQALARPTMSMMIVDERFGLHNTIVTLMRINDLIAAASLFFLFAVTDRAAAVALFGVVPAGLNIILLMLVVAYIWRTDPSLIPNPRLIHRDTLRDIGGTFGWNAGVILAANLHERDASSIMNIAFGLWGSAVFGLSFRLVSYVRMGTMGMTFGIDASATRMSAENNQARLRRLLEFATRSHAMVALPAAAVVIALPGPLLWLWIGTLSAESPPVLPAAAGLARLMMVALAARAISDGWLRILYGAGHVRAYAKVILLGGLLSPPLSILLIVVLPSELAYTAVGWSYLTLILIFHCGVAPMLGARRLDLAYRDFVAPVLRPALAAAAPAPVLLLEPWAVRISGAPAIGLLATLGAYGVLYSVMVLLIVLSRAERARFSSAALRRLRAITGH